MEYEILDIPENSSLECAKRAIHKIRLRHHPDKLFNLSESEKEKSAIILRNAESAYKRIKQLKSVGNIIDNLITPKPFISPEIFGFPKEFWKDISSLQSNTSNKRNTNYGSKDGCSNIKYCLSIDRYVTK